MLVFTRTPDAALTSLVKQLDQLITSQPDSKLASFVCVIDDDVKIAEEAARDLARKNALKHVAVTVPVDHKNGPEAFGISPDAEVTLMCYKGTEVQANYAFAAGELNAAAMAKVMADVAKMLP